MVELDGDGNVRLLRFNTQQMKTIPLAEPRLAEYYAAYHELSHAGKRRPARRSPCVWKADRFC